MKYHALFVIFEKAENLKLSSAANYRWRFKGKGVAGKKFYKMKYFPALKIGFILPNSENLMKHPLMQHSIWVFTVCKSTCLPISRIKMVKNKHDTYYTCMYLGILAHTGLTGIRESFRDKLEVI